MMLAMLNPAHHVIEKCGGFDAVARMTGRSTVRVRRWCYPRDRGGTGGLIPADMQPVLMRRARAAGIDLGPADFFHEIDASADAPAQGDAA